MRVVGLVRGCLAALGLMLMTACAGVPFPEWKTVNAPRALEQGTDEALLEALEANVDENSTGSFYATRVGRAEHLLLLLLREGGDRWVNGPWLRDVRWDLVERVRKAEPRVRWPLNKRATDAIRGHGQSFGFAAVTPAALDDFLANDLTHIAKTCRECVLDWSRGYYPVTELRFAAGKGHQKTLTTLFGILGPQISQQLCASQQWSGGGPMDSVRDGDLATRAVLASCGARKHSAEEQAEKAREVKEQDRLDEERAEQRAREAMQERAEQNQRYDEERRRAQASERRRLNEMNQGAMENSQPQIDPLLFTSHDDTPPPSSDAGEQPTAEPPPKKPPPDETCGECCQRVRAGKRGCDRPQ